MRNISIHYLKKIPLLFFLIKTLYSWLKKIEFYFNRYQSREYRAEHYRKQIDGYLKSRANIDYKKISIKIEKEIHKRAKFELKLTSKWWLLFI